MTGMAGAQITVSVAVYRQVPVPALIVRVNNADSVQLLTRSPSRAPAIANPLCQAQVSYRGILRGEVETQTSDSNGLLFRLA